MSLSHNYATKSPLVITDNWYNLNFSFLSVRQF